MHGTRLKKQAIPKSSTTWRFAFEANRNVIYSIFKPVSWLAFFTSSVGFCHAFLLGYWRLACRCVCIPICLIVIKTDVLLCTLWILMIVDFIWEYLIAACTPFQLLMYTPPPPLRKKDNNPYLERSRSEVKVIKGYAKVKVKATFLTIFQPILIILTPRH